MEKLVAIQGACISCPMSRSPGPGFENRLVGTSDPETCATDQTILTENDFTVGFNIFPFLGCALTPTGRCTPLPKTAAYSYFASPWKNTAEPFADIEEKILTEGSYFECIYGDTKVTITKAGQEGVTVGDLYFCDGELTMKEAEELFEYLAEQDDIAFGYPVDGCYSRAHLMIQKMLELGVPEEILGKIWTAGNLRVETNTDPRGEVKWSWHVAPTISVIDEDGNVVQIVIDPSIESEPVTTDEWVETSADGGTTQVRETDTSYYVPGPPPEGESSVNLDNLVAFSDDEADTAAEKTMELYLPCEEEFEAYNEGGGYDEDFLQACVNLDTEAIADEING